MSADDSSFEINIVRVSRNAERRAEFTSTVSRDIVAHHHGADWREPGRRGRFRGEGGKEEEMKKASHERGNMQDRLERLGGGKVDPNSPGGNKKQ